MHDQAPRIGGEAGDGVAEGGSAQTAERDGRSILTNVPPVFAAGVHFDRYDSIGLVGFVALVASLISMWWHRP
jgi:hypothetical protein